MATPPKDVRPSLYVPPDSSNRSYFAHDAIRSGNRDPVDSRVSEFQRFAGDLRDPAEREKEKDRMRAEIMAEQAERRRILEDEIRKELMLESQVARERWKISRTRFDNPLQGPPSLHDPVRVRSDAPPQTRPFPFVHQPVESRQYVDERSRMVPSQSRQLVDERSRIMRIDAPSAVHQFAHDRSRLHTDAPSGIRQFVHEPQRIPQTSSYLEDRRMFLTMPQNHRVAGDRFMASSGYQHHPMMPTTSNLVMLDSKPAHREIRRDGIFGSFPQQHQMLPSTLSMPRKERNLLENREGYISDLIRKRKASGLGTDHYTRSNLEKKPKEVWRCDLCKVVASSKRNLKDHLDGKKHKLMVEETSNPVKKESTPNTEAIRIETSCAPSTIINEKQNIVTGETLEKVETVLDKALESKTDEAASSSEAATTEKKQKIVKVDKKKKIAMVDKKQGNGSGINGGTVKKMKFWCGICQVGVTSQKSLADHEKGKKHMEVVQEKAKIKP